MDHDARKISKTLRDLLQGRQRGKLRKFFLIHAKMTTEAVLEEIVLLPAIERRIKRHGKIFLNREPSLFGKTMQFYDFIEGRLVEGPAHEPAFLAVTPKIVFSEIFDPDQAFRGIVKINSGRANAVLGQELCDLDVMPVLFALEAVLNENDRLLRRAADAIEFPVRAAFLDRRDLDLRFLEAREMNPRLPEQLIGPGRSRCRCH